MRKLDARVSSIFFLFRIKKKKVNFIPITTSNTTCLFVYKYWVVKIVTIVVEIK